MKVFVASHEECYEDNITFFHILSVHKNKESAVNAARSYIKQKKLNLEEISDEFWESTWNSVSIEEVDFIDD